MIIDDSSEEGTLEYLKIYSKKHHFLKFIVGNSKPVLDTSHKWPILAQKKYCNLITVDTDLSYDPKIITKIIKLLNYSKQKVL